MLLLQLLLVLTACHVQQAESLTSLQQTLCAQLLRTCTYCALSILLPASAGIA